MHFSPLLWLVSCCLLVGQLFADTDSTCQASRSHIVLVSVAPHVDLIQRIAGDTLAVELLVPAGVSMHTYEPNPKQVLKVAKADLWFGIGETFESKLLQALQTQNRCLQFVDLRNGVDLIYCDPRSSYGHCHCCQKNGADLHIWLSPKQMKAQAIAIAQALQSKYPEHAKLYQKNLDQLLQDLDQLDRELTVLFAQAPSRTFMVAHAAYAYLARDYNLKQIPIEYEGRDPSPRQLTELLQQARQAGVTIIFTQPQYGDKAAKLIAESIGARLVSLDPYNPDYFASMRRIGQAISGKAP